MSNKVKNIIDNFWAATVLRVAPGWITPNFFSFFRLSLIPVIVGCLFFERFGLALLFLVLAGLADTLDGSLARERKMVSRLGRILDPAADKFLVVLISLFLIFYYPFYYLPLTVAVLDFLTLLGAGVFWLAVGLEYSEKIPPANWWGRGKMIFEIFGLAAGLGYLGWPGQGMLWLSAGLLFLAVFFSLVSLIIYSVQGIRTVLKG